MKGHLLYVGAHKDAVKEARAMIMEIIKSSNSESVKIEALQAARYICEVKNTTIHSCTFTSK